MRRKLSPGRCIDPEIVATFESVKTGDSEESVVVVVRVESVSESSPLSLILCTSDCSLARNLDSSSRVFVSISLSSKDEVDAVVE